MTKNLILQIYLVILILLINTNAFSFSAKPSSADEQQIINGLKNYICNDGKKIEDIFFYAQKLTFGNFIVKDYTLGHDIKGNALACVDYNLTHINNPDNIYSYCWRIASNKKTFTPVSDGSIVLQSGADIFTAYIIGQIDSINPDNLDKKRHIIYKNLLHNLSVNNKPFNVSNILNWYGATITLIDVEYVSEQSAHDNRTYPGIVLKIIFDINLSKCQSLACNQIRITLGDDKSNDSIFLKDNFIVWRQPVGNKNFLSQQCNSVPAICKAVNF